MLRTTAVSRAGLLLLSALAAAPSFAAHDGLQEATADSAIVRTGESVLIDVLANDAEVGASRRLVNVLPAGNGRTRVENGQVRYTPAPGFEGADQFRYLVQAPKSPPRIGIVDVDVGSGAVNLSLSGQVVDDPIPFATVTVSVGGFDFTATADENGHYTIDIAALSGGDLVTVTAVGTSGTGAPVYFKSLVGAIARLDAEAGADGILTMDENNQVNATHLSTAQYVLLADANGGTPPATDDDLLQLTQNINLDELIELAAVIKLVVDGGESLPAGVDNVLELISDETALDAFVEALDPGQLDDAIADVADESGDLAGFSPTRMAVGYTAIFPGDTGTIRVGVGGQFLVHFDGVGATSGTGEITDFTFRDDPGITWAIVDDELHVRLDQPLVFEIDEFFADDCWWHRVQTFTGYDITRLQDGATVDYLQVHSTGSNVYTDPDPTDACVPPEDNEFGDEGAWTMLGFEEGAGELPFGATESFGTMMLPYYRPGMYANSPNTAPWGAGLFDFATSQTQAAGFDPTFGWSVSGGRLRLTLTDLVAGVRDLEYRRYQTDGRKGEGVMAIVTDAAGRKAALYTLAVRVDGSLPAFTLAMLPGRWRSGFDISQFPGETQVATGFFLRMHDDAARTGVFESVAYDSLGNLVTSLFPPMTWGVGSGEYAGMMEALTFTRPGFGRLAWCDVGVDAGCALWRRRTWTPLAIDGNRVYVLERLNYTVVAGPELVAERANFYEVGPIP
jgi:hypothetical protein